MHGSEASYFSLLNYGVLEFTSLRTEKKIGSCAPAMRQVSLSRKAALSFYLSFKNSYYGSGFEIFHKERRQDFINH
jgi:hypothetical protein